MVLARNIIIVGITGAGKTTIGKLLADRLKKQFIDLDKYIELSCGVDIPTIFELEGEAGFRERETQALKQVIDDNQDYVLSLGGGCVVKTLNRKIIMQSTSVVLQLIADLDILAARLTNSPNKRPLLFNQDIYQKIQHIFKERKEFYDMVSDFTINTSHLKPSQVATNLEKQLRYLCG